MKSGGRDQLVLVAIAIEKPAGEMVFHPEAEDRIEAGDRPVPMGQTASLRQLEDRLRG